MQWSIHDEIGAKGAVAFLEGYVPALLEEVLRYLGQLPERRVRIVLSNRACHEQRFPPALEELAPLVDLLGEVPEESRRLEVARIWGVYAHGIATVATPANGPPAGVETGDDVIYLDLETIAELAGELVVSFEGFLARVIAHEMSHVVRGHTGDECQALHSWNKEGDAQRDAWHVLAELLAQPDWVTVARNARAAQVRLSARQSGAYKCFPLTDAENCDLVSSTALLPLLTWVIKPPREVFILSRSLSVETPVVNPQRGGVPVCGDSVFLADRAMVSGPWAVIRRQDHSHLRHSRDLDAAGCRLRSHSDAKISWLVLRPLGELCAARTRHESGAGPLEPRQLDRAEAFMINETVGSPAGAVVDAVAAESAADWQRSCQYFEPGNLADEYDPFAD